MALMITDKGTRAVVKSSQKEHGPSASEGLPASDPVVRATTVLGEHRDRCPETTRRLWPFEHPRQPDESWCSIRRGTGYTAISSPSICWAWHTRSSVPCFCYFASNGSALEEALRSAAGVASESCRFHGTREWMKHST